MLRSLLVSTSLLALASAGYGFAAEAISSPASLPASPQVRVLLPIEQGIARFRMSFGRLHFDRIGGRDRERYAFEDANGTTESYWVRPASDGVEAEYERVRPGLDRITFRVEPSDGLRLTRSDLTGSEGSIEILQPSEGWMTLSYSAGEERRTLRGPSLWHLYVEDPEFCNHCVTPVLREVGVTVGYKQLGDKLALLVVDRASFAEFSTSRDEFLGWVYDLSDPSFKVRRAAEEQLRRIGPALIAWVRLYPVDKLDREQCNRLRELVSTLEASSEDEPLRLAAWLADDPWIWGKLLIHSDADVRKVAAERIELLTGESLESSADRTVIDDESLRRTYEQLGQDRGSLR